LLVAVHALPADVAPVALVQPVTAGFTASFARRIDGLAAVEITGADVRWPVAAALDGLQTIRALAGRAVGPAATGFLEQGSDLTTGTDPGHPDRPRHHLETTRAIVL
jgi:hypothetical protein